MAMTFKNYNRGNATISDIQKAWKQGQLPKQVELYFDNHITDVSIRSLYQSGFNLFKDSLVVDNVIEIHNFVIIVSKDRGDWQVVFYQYKEGALNKMGLVHEETAFVKNDKNLLKVIVDLIIEYRK